MKLHLSLAAAAIALPVLAHAQPVTGPYVSLGAGTSFISPTSVNFEATGGSGKYQFRPDYAGVAGIGYGFGDGFRVEIGGEYTRNTVHAADQAAVGLFPATHFRATGGEEKYGALVNVYYDISTGLPITPYIGAGGGYLFTKYNTDLTTVNGGVAQRTSGTKGSFAYNIIAGVAYPVAAVPGLSLTAEYRFLQLLQSRSYLDSVNGSNAFTTKAKIGQEISHTFLFGVRYQLFNPPPPAPAPEQVLAPTPVAAPAPTPAKTYLVFFDWDRYDLSPRALDIIAQAATDSRTVAITTIEVSGYTDTSGTPSYNNGLSLRRAKAVAAQLVIDGVSASQIETQGYGETHLLVPTGPGVREPQNRRVEIVVQ